jgi:hypothetical protein
MMMQAVYRLEQTRAKVQAFGGTSPELSFVCEKIDQGFA